jgi:hypothetical protein
MANVDLDRRRGPRSTLVRCGGFNGGIEEKPVAGAAYRQRGRGSALPVAAAALGARRLGRH